MAARKLGEVDVRSPENMSLTMQPPAIGAPVELQRYRPVGDRDGRRTGVARVHDRLAFERSTGLGRLGGRRVASTAYVM
jgi:hypothetical protein